MGQGASCRLSGVVGVFGLAILLSGQAMAADLTGRQGLGGSIGSSLMIGDSDYRAHARPRFFFDAMFKYGFRPRMAIVAGFGYGWNAYTNEERWLIDPDFADLRSGLGYGSEPLEKVVAVSPFTVGLEYRFGEEAWVPYVGVGGGVYMLELLFERQVARDPQTLAKHRTFNPGLYARVGVEQFLTESVSLDYEALGHLIFSEDRTKFPNANGDTVRIFGEDYRAYGGDAQFVQVRAGVRYYWGEEE
jgi:hypothetical protein